MVLVTQRTTSRSNGTGKDRAQPHAKDRDPEIAGLAAAVKHYQSQGRDYKDQAILCRGHSYIQKIAAGLKRLAFQSSISEIFSSGRK